MAWPYSHCRSEEFAAAVATASSYLCHVEHRAPQPVPAAVVHKRSASRSLPASPAPPLQPRAAVASPTPTRAPLKHSATTGFGLWRFVATEETPRDEGHRETSEFETTTLFANGRWLGDSSEEEDEEEEQAEDAAYAAAAAAFRPDDVIPSAWFPVLLDAAADEEKGGGGYALDTHATTASSRRALSLVGDAAGADELACAWRAGIVGAARKTGRLQLTESWREYMAWLAATRFGLSEGRGDEADDIDAAAAAAEIAAAVARRRNLDTLRRARRRAAQRRREEERRAAAAAPPRFESSAQARHVAELEAALNAQFDAFADRERPAFWPETALR